MQEISHLRQISCNLFHPETIISSFLYYEDYDEMEEETREIYRAGMAAFEGIAPEYHIELSDRPTVVWDFHSLLLAIQMMFSFMLVDETATLKLCPTAIRHSLQRMKMIFIAARTVKRENNSLGI